METVNYKAIQLNQYPFQSTDKIRYADTDRQGHVNNAVFNQFFETGRIELLYNPMEPLYADGCSFVIANLKADYLAEIKWPGIVYIGTGVVRIGNSSLHLVQGIFQDDKLVALGETVIVQVENQTSKSKISSQHAKHKLTTYLIENIKGI